MRRLLRLCRRSWRVILDGSRVTLPLSLVLMAATAALVLRIAPEASVTTRLMVAAPRFTKDLDASIVNVDAVELARMVTRELTKGDALRRVAYVIDLMPSGFGPETGKAVAGLRPTVEVTSATDKDKVTVISIEVRMPESARALAASAALADVATALDLGMREEILIAFQTQALADLDVARMRLAGLGPREVIDTSASVVAGLTTNLEARRDELNRTLGRLFRNDPSAAELRRQIAGINERLRTISLATAGGTTAPMTREIADARALIANWQAEESARRAAVQERERARDQLSGLVNSLEAKLATVASALALERMEANRRVTMMNAPQLRSANLPPPDILALASALVIGLAAWLGGAMVVEGLNPRLRDAHDLVRSLNIAAFSVIPDIEQPKRVRVRRRPERGPLANDPVVFVRGSHA